MKKFLSYLSNLGSLCVFIAFIWVLIAEDSWHVFRYVPSRYILCIGFMMEFPFYCYKMWHWEEYKIENRFNWVFVHILFAAILILLLLKIL